MTLRSISVVAVVIMSSMIVCGQAVDCGTSYNKTKGPYPYGQMGTKQHITQDHSWTNLTGGQCIYKGTAQFNVYVPCEVHSTATSNSGAADYGSTFPYYHSATWKDQPGGADGPDGGTAISDAQGAASITSCLFVPCEAVPITISGAGNGTGFNVNFGTSSPLWDSSFHYTNTCTARTLPPLQPTVVCPTPNPPTPPGFTDGGGGNWAWNPYTCTWVNTSGASPVIIDTTGKGFHFTDPTKGNYVSFDIEGHGVFLKVSWPEHESGNAWLALDRDGDGVIKDGTELFGNFTPHADGGVPNHPNPNGFLALDWYDQPAQGGDMNLILDRRDAIWPKLRLWIDEHCYKEPDTPCRSLPNELHTLESKGVTSISLVWDASEKTDAVGNEFRFFTVLNPEAETTPKDEHGNSCCDLHQQSKDGRLAYDVYLKTVK